MRVWQWERTYIRISERSSKVLLMYTVIYSCTAAFIEIGSDNLSAVIGLYVQPVMTATLRHGIPYFVMGDLGHDQLPYNLISVRPRPSDLYTLTVDIVRIYNWSSVAVIYERPFGMSFISLLCTMIHYSKTLWTRT